MTSTWQLIDDERRYLETPTPDVIRLNYLYDLRAWSDSMLWQLEQWQLDGVEIVPDEMRLVILELFNRCDAEFDGELDTPVGALDCVFLVQEKLFGLLLWVKRGLTNAEVEAIFDELDESIAILEESS